MRPLIVLLAIIFSATVLKADIATEYKNHDSECTVFKCCAKDEAGNMKYNCRQVNVICTYTCAWSFKCSSLHQGCQDIYKQPCASSDHGVDVGLQCIKAGNHSPDFSCDGFAWTTESCSFNPTKPCTGSSCVKECMDHVIATDFDGHCVEEVIICLTVYQ